MIKKVKIIGALPGAEVFFVRCISHQGHLDSVIDHFCYDNDCSEDEFIRESDEEAEIRFIKKWLNRNLGAEERRKLIKIGGCL